MPRKQLLWLISSHATIALSMLRDSKGGFDIVISDVHMPDMDGYELLEHVGLEMDLPVIMMSADGGTCSVMRGIKHGACDYLIKPVRIEELKNIWQHVVRKKCSGSKGPEHSDSAEETEQHRRAGDGAEYSDSFVNNTGTDGSCKAQKKRRDVREDEGDGELDNGDPSMSKKPRVVWSVELHMKFVNAVDQLGIDKAVPKRILELMNVPGLTRENVASHLQCLRFMVFKADIMRWHCYKYEAAWIHPNAATNYQPDATAAGSFGGPREIIESRDNKSSAVGRSDLQTWATLDQIPSPTTLAALHAELSGRPTASLFLPGTNQHLLHHTSLQGFKSFPIEGGVMPIRHPKLEYQSSTSKLFSQPSISFEDIPSALPVWARNHLGSEASASNIGGLTTHSSNRYGQILCQQQQQQWPLVHPPEPGHTVNLQTSRLIAAPQSSNSFWTRNNNPILINPSSSIGNSIEYSMSLVPFNNASLGSFPDRDFKNAAGLGGCSFPELGTSSTSVSSAHLVAETGTWLREHDAVANMNSASRLLGPVSNICKIPSANTRPAVLEEQAQSMNRAFVGKGTSIQGLFAVHQTDSASDNESHDKNM
ncbi:hypothetical protein ACLOJK_023609 [Asimina triloba]